ncbi:MAG: hypothetical protein H6822_17920 [Planctomycetaceae bacterium]|nr:hypothetical protein [Planctomycetaceae bacterium]
MNRLGGFESLEDRIALSATPFGAQPEDTAEFLLGTVNVSVVLLESNKVLSSDNPTVGTQQEENWTASSIAAVKQKVTDGLQWWVDTFYSEFPNAPAGSLDFHIDFTHADTPVSTRFEPITQPSTDYQFWAQEFLNTTGVATTGSLFTDIKTFNNEQRVAQDTNWSYTIFVVNDEHDFDHRFAPGGLDRAFAFPGGMFLVTLASRPASTITHETGHIFWALDEYQGGSSYDVTRGYYNTPNTNAWNNTTPNFVREPSIMDRGSCEEGGGLLCDAFEAHTSSPSSLELIGWRDSDGDGLMDVLDVPFTLEGTGAYDPDSGVYRFVGESSVQTLPNLNPRESALPTESLQNDITINRISRAEYRIDGGVWQTAASPDTYVAALDLSFAVPSTANQVEIRTIDAVTGVTSPVFVADLSRPASVQQPGINGFVYSDADSDGMFETGESGLAGVTVRLVDASGQPITRQYRIEPDDYGANAAINNVVPAATLTAIGTATSGSTVYARSVGQGSTGSQAFSACSFTGSGNTCSIYQSEWTSSTRQLRINFASPVTTVSIDAVSNNPADYGRLAIYDANDNLLGRYTTDALASGEYETMTLSRPTADIAYAIAGGHADTGVRLDNLHFGPSTTAVTNAFGAYMLPSLETGSYRVQVLGTTGSQGTTPTTQAVAISGAAPVASVDFGFVAVASPWQNASNRFDANNDGVVSPIDALLIINELNSNGSRKLTSADVTPPFMDVNGDGYVAPIDVLQVINDIESSLPEGESYVEAGVPVASERIVAPAAEGEFVPLPPSVRGATTESELSSSGRGLSDFTTPAPLDVLAGQSSGPSFNSLRDFSHVEQQVWRELLDENELRSTIDALAEDLAVAWTNNG